MKRLILVAVVVGVCVGVFLGTRETVTVDNEPIIKAQALDTPPR